MGKWWDRFWARPRVERWILLACAVFIPTELALKAYGHAVAQGDFNVHRDFGMRLLDGTPLYRGGHCFNYMPISALYYAPLAMVPTALASLGRTSAAFLSLAYVCWALGSMVRDRARTAPWPALTTGALAVALCGQYVLRDLDDGGPHLIYLALIVAGLQAVRRGREGWAAAAFGLAVALKMTPGLLIPFLAWKRRWRLAIATGLATLAWIALPALVMGPSSWWHHQTQWNRVALDVFGGRMGQDRQVNEVRVQNQALRPAVARLLTAYPEGHPLKLHSPLDVPLGHLDERWAERCGSLAGLALLGAVAWWSRRPWVGGNDPALPLEFAAVLALMPLLSPVTWLQHLSFLLPAAYLLAAERLAFRPWSRSVAWAVGAFALVALVCNRGLIGRDASLLLMSWHGHTWAALGLLILLMTARPTASRGEPTPSAIAASASTLAVPPRPRNSPRSVLSWGSKLN